MGNCSTKPPSTSNNNHNMESKNTNNNNNNNNNKKNTNDIIATTTTTTNSDSNDKVVVQEFELKKYRPGCTGMFWRPDPTGQTKLVSNNNWPRDGAKLRGHVIEHHGSKWLLATHVLQKNDAEWKSAPKGAAMPFEYNHHYYLE
jgi:hypothetical protein